MKLQQGHIKEDKILEYSTGYYSPLQNSIRWRNYQLIDLPKEYQASNPKSFVMCVYPTGNPYYKGKPTITFTTVDTKNPSDFETVVEQEIPASKANFKAYVEIEFRYRKGKYVYGSKLIADAYKNCMVVGNITGFWLTKNLVVIL